MDGLILLKLLCSIVVFTRASNAKFSCTSAKCTLLSPEVRSPFRLRGIHPHQCGLSGFTLFCKQNKTAIHFHGDTDTDLFVKTISYDSRSLSLVDPRNCVHQVFLNLNLSLTPFRYYYAVHHYTYVNCSAKLVRFEPVPCLSGSNHHVYVVEPSFPLPVSCSAVKTVAIPFSYSPYLSDSSFGLRLTWPSTRVDEPPAKSHQTGHSDLEYNYRVLCAVLRVIAVVFIIGKLLYASLSKYGDQFNEEKIEGMLGEIKSDKLLGDYEALDALRL